MNELEKNNFGVYELIAVISQVLNQRNFLGVCFVFAIPGSSIIKIIIKKSRQQRIGEKMLESCGKTMLHQKDVNGIFGLQSA